MKECQNERDVFLRYYNGGIIVNFLNRQQGPYLRISLCLLCITYSRRIFDAPIYWCSCNCEEHGTYLARGTIVKLIAYC